KDDISNIASTENFHALTCLISVQPLESTYHMKITLIKTS
ncbi:1946_t:CDS:1, partial [Ambispora gerdemannii]